jgi:formylglycine-generating enzyme required for sulfatase activity
MDIVKKTACAATAVCLAAACMMADLFGAVDFDIVGTVESVRKDNVIAMLFDEAPRTGTYYIVDGGAVYATVEVRATEYVRTGSRRYRVVATYTLTNDMYAAMIRAGTDVGIPRGSGRTGREFGDAGRVIEKGPRSAIVCRKDGKEMVLVPEGKFVFGANDGERDESPEQVVFLHDYYIDRHEVSNDEYARFIESSGARPPLSWTGAVFPEGVGALPVAVTYREAEAYAQWAGKRLPT